MATVQDVAATCACMKVRKAARAVTRAYSKALRPSGLQGTQFSMLVAASMAGGVPLGRLADVLGLERTTMTRNLQLLERDGLIRLANVDGRTRNVAVTEAGAARLAQALPLWERAQGELSEKLGAEGWAAVQGMLGTLAGAA